MSFDHKHMINALVSQATNAATNKAFTQTLGNLVSEAVESEKTNQTQAANAIINVLFTLLSPVTFHLPNNAFAECLAALMGIGDASFELATMVVKVCYTNHSN